MGGRRGVSKDVGRLLGGDAGTRAYSSGRYQNGERNDGGVGVVYGDEGGALVAGVGVAGEIGVSGIVGSVALCRVLSRFPSVLAFGLILVMRVEVGARAAGGVTGLSSTGTASFRKSAESRDLFTTIPAVVRRMCPLRRSGSV